MSEKSDIPETFNAQPFSVLGDKSVPIKFTCPTMVGEFSINPKREIELGRAQVNSFLIIKKVK